MASGANVGGTWRPLTGVHVRVGGNWVRCKEVFAYHNGAWRSVFLDTMTFTNISDRIGASIHQMMGSPTRVGKYVFINNATIGANSTGFALRTGPFAAGSQLTIINQGAILGLGGAANGGAGGTAFYADVPCTIDNTNGTIFGGGGGGGRGGTGGGGLYPVETRLPATGAYGHNASYVWMTNMVSGNMWTEIVWAGAVVRPRSQGMFLGNSYPHGNLSIRQGGGGSTDTSGNPARFSVHAIQTTQHNSNGGAGGSGGRGEGYLGAAANGANGAAGGSHAGYGGVGGRGGAWGVAGSAGATGNTGNRTGGSAGAAGGAAGRAVSKNGHAVTITGGTSTDRLKGPVV